MNMPLIVITDCGFPSTAEEERIVTRAGMRLEVLQCRTPAEVAAQAAHADALINQHVRLTREALRALTRCKAIVRYGVGVDNVDVTAATQLGIAVCNVPDYGVGEVAEHALALALALNRQLPQLDRRLRGGVWSYSPPASLQSFAELTFATAGFGRIARALHEKIRGLGCRRIACDPFVDDAVFEQAGVRRVQGDALFAQADILSLHLALTDSTRHFVNETRLRQMKPRAILINTARGGLVDTVALARALQAGALAAAGLDVFEEEPPPADHPIFQAPNTILTSHNAYYSDASIARLQRWAAEEAVRAVQGAPLRCRVN